MVVRDDNDALVGVFLDADASASLGRPDRAAIVIQTDVFGTTRTYIVDVTPSSFQSVDARGIDHGWFKQINCGGDLFKDQAPLLGMEVAFVESGFAHIADSTAVPESFTALSVRESDGRCSSPTSIPVTDVIATVDVDLDALFVPDYTLGF